METKIKETKIKKETKIEKVTKIRRDTKKIKKK